MSTLSRKVNKAVVTYDPSSNTSSIVIKDPTLFPSGFKLNLRFDSAHANLVRSALMDSNPNFDWERVANDAYFNYMRNGTSSTDVFIGADTTGKAFTYDVNQSRIPLVILDDTSDIMGSFLRNQLVNKDPNRNIYILDWLVQSATITNGTGVRSIDMQEALTEIQGADTHTTVFMVNPQQYARNTTVRKRMDAVEDSVKFFHHVKTNPNLWFIVDFMVPRCPILKRTGDSDLSGTYDYRTSSAEEGTTSVHLQLPPLYVTNPSLSRGT